MSTPAADHPARHASLTRLETIVERVVADTLHLCRIPAPTFDEAARADYVAERMRAIGLADVQRDALHNVTGVSSHGQTGPTLMVVAHIDTVFPRSTPLTVHRTSERLYGPSIGDNSVAVSAMLHVADALCHLPAAFPGRVVFAASVGEEGLGNLCGIRALLDTWQPQIDAVIAVEGHGLDDIRHVGIGSRRLEITFEGPGGHSWGAFGTPSAIHALGQAVYQLSHLPLPSSPKTTYNVGLITGGESVNTIAPRASMLVDLRSLEPTALQRLDTQLTELLHDVERHSGVHVTSRVVGERPAAALPRQHPLCQAVHAIRQHLRLRPGRLSAASTDANLPLSRGIPALCLGITHGGQAHTVREYIDIAPIADGLQQLFGTVLHILSHPECGVWHPASGGTQQTIDPKHPRKHP